MSKYNKIIYTLPAAVTREIIRLSEARGGDRAEISEIRLRLNGKSSVTLGGERVDICSRVCIGDMEKTFLSLCGGAVYAHRDTVSEGYISCEGGVRVGIGGEARYEGERLVGVSNVSSLVFRIPSRKKYRMNEIFEAWMGTRRGMLIYSPPGVGKTTALRALAEYIAGAEGQELVIVDTRREFCAEDYSGLRVDILSGYRRERGMEIALRTMSPDVIMVDEIGRSEEAEAMAESLNSGIRIAASAHAGSISELRRRRNLSDFFKLEIFDTFVGISMEGGRRVMKIGGVDA